MHDQHEPDVYDMLDELTLPHHHDQLVTRDPDAVTGTAWTERHRVHVPPLLDQLDNPTPTATGDGGGAREFESQPAAHLESLDLLTAIDHEALELAGSDAGSTIGTVRRAGARLGNLQRCAHPRGRAGCCDWHTVEHQIRRWWAMARVVAGWDEASWRPNATCPRCGRRGGLRIRVADRIGTCIECRETWHPGTIGLLGNHIRTETLAAAVAGRLTPCQLVDGYEPPDDAVLDHVCSSCGRARCVRAVTLALTCPEECDSKRCRRVAAEQRRWRERQDRAQAVARRMSASRAASA